MEKYRRIIAVAGVAAAFLFACYSLATAPKLEIPALAQATATPEISNATRAEYREAVSKRMEMGERVSVPDDRIGYLDGDVKLVRKKEVSKESITTKSIDRMTKISSRAEIDRIAARLTDSRFRDGLKAFASNATDEQKLDFLNVGGKLYLDDFTDGTKAVPRPTDNPEKKCYDSCQTICHIGCREVCTWDCRIVNGEKVCERSCSTICPEVCNVVCKKVCD